MSDSRVDLKHPLTAGILAFLIPGAGHLYQGRLFKAALYSTCILGTFFYGMYLGRWHVVYYMNAPGNKTLGYLAQVFTGLPALPALVQNYRYGRPENDTARTLQQPLEADFAGVLQERTADDEFTRGFVRGRISLRPERSALGPEVVGTFQGTFLTEDGPREIRRELADMPITGQSRSGFKLEQKVFADPGRKLGIEIVEGRNDDLQTVGRIEGEIPRSVWNWYAVPPDEVEQQRLHGELGKFFELASVFTWIAGLLNILAIWDAVEGPAYGRSDEQPEDEQPEPDSEVPPTEGSVTANR